MFVTKIRPRVSETDGVGHINNTFVPVWFEAGREEIFRILTPDLSFKNWHLAVVNMNVDFTNQIHFGTEVEVRTWVHRFGNKSFMLYEEMFQGEILCAKGTVTYVYMDYQAQKSAAIPEPIRNELQKHLKET
ncbi:thioesterase family protein [Aeromicrobium ponti]|uniref:Acyl-CoA thioester hydrolase n=1 Tax=Cytobacillus oceanisediminis TaxID=665099 RepID=A0A562JRE8_9BACI|nr:thioesterase family protein [Cytobacillus oceanisediminis]TWH85721.1 acyl-CoA thioester hydrolase [Cytobacillus oceanisediminis]